MLVTATALQVVAHCYSSIGAYAFDSELANRAAAIVTEVAHCRDVELQL